MATITIDGKEYDSESMSKEALAQVQSIQYVNNQHGITNESGCLSNCPQHLRICAEKYT